MCTPVYRHAFNLPKTSLIIHKNEKYISENQSRTTTNKFKTYIFKESKSFQNTNKNKQVSDLVTGQQS